MGSNNTTKNKYFAIFSSFTYDELEYEVNLGRDLGSDSSYSAKQEIATKVGKFLTEGTIPILNPDNAEDKIIAKAMYETELETRQEALLATMRKIKKLNTIDSTRSEAEVEVIREQLHLHLYHCLYRFAALKSQTDTEESYDTKLFECCLYLKICTEFLLEFESNLPENLKQKTKFKQDLSKTINDNQPELSSFAFYFIEKNDGEQTSDYLIRQAKRLNEVRLYWLWVRISMELFIPVAEAILQTSALIAGYMSYVLYYLLSAISIVGIFNHFLKKYLYPYLNLIGLNLKETNSFLKDTDSIMRHISLRLYAILNFLVWGLVNFACFFWLYGPGIFGAYGDLSTTLLLCMDLTLTYLGYSSEKSSFKKNKEIYAKNLEQLEFKIIDSNNQEAKELLELIKKDTTSSADSSEELSDKLKKATLDKDLKKQIIRFIWKYSLKQDCEYRWDTRTKYHINNIAFCIAFLVGCILLSGLHMVFVGIAPPLAIIMAGAIFLCIYTALWKTLDSAMKLHDMNSGITTSRNEFSRLLTKLEIAINSTKYDLLHRKVQNQLSGQIIEKGLDIGYQEDLFLYKKLECSREALSRFLIPSAIIVTILLAPATLSIFPTYLVVALGAIIATAMVVTAIKKCFTPKAATWKLEKSESNNLIIPVKADDNNAKIAVDMMPNKIHKIGRA